MNIWKERSKKLSEACNHNKWKLLLLLLVLLVLIVATLVLTLVRFGTDDLLLYDESELGNYSRAAISIDGRVCAGIGKDVLLDGGTAVDAAIAALICNGVVNSQSMGIGGGFLMTVYNTKTGVAESLIAREKAPLAATIDMFENDTMAAQQGPLAVAVPGEIAGYWEAKIKYGNSNITWQRLFQPTVDMCRTGIAVSWTHANVLLAKEEVMTDVKMREIFINPETGRVWQEGDVYTRQDFANTLEQLAKAGDEGLERLGFYTGPIGGAFVSDLQQLGGIITMEDLKNYQANWVPPIKVHLESLQTSTLYSVPPPGSGAILGYILNIVDLFHLNYRIDHSLLYHRLAESFKWGFAKRTELGDPLGDLNITDYITKLVGNLTSEEWAADSFSKINDSFTVNNASYYGAVFDTPEDHGTAHVSVLDEFGLGVSATSTINLYFGAIIMSNKTGIIYNDEMDDFSFPGITNYFGVPPSPNNFIKPGKRPLSSMCPSIIVDKDGKVSIVVGAAGGTKITTSVALTTIWNQWLGLNVKEAVDRRRIHHQLMPMEVSYEPGFSKDILTSLEEKQHRTTPMDSFGSVVGAISRGADGRLYANADFRKAGGVDGY